MKSNLRLTLPIILAAGGLVWSLANAQPPASVPALPKAFIDGSGPGWRSLGSANFTNVNCDPGTWRWDGETIYCTGQPLGAIRTREPVTNFEMVVQWRHLRPRRQFGACSFGPARNPSGNWKPAKAACPMASKCRCSTRLHRAIRKANRQEGRLVHAPMATCFRSARRR